MCVGQWKLSKSNIHHIWTEVLWAILGFVSICFPLAWAQTVTGMIALGSLREDKHDGAELLASAQQRALWVRQKTPVRFGTACYYRETKPSPTSVLGREEGHFEAQMNATLTNWSLGNSLVTRSLSPTQCLDTWTEPLTVAFLWDGPCSSPLSPHGI